MAASAPIFPNVAPTRGRAVLLVGAVFAFFFAAYAFTLSGDIFSTGDTTIRVEIAENMLFHRSVVLDGWDLQYPHHIKKEFLDPRVSVGRGGKTYSTYLPGQPLAIMLFDGLANAMAIHERWPLGATVSLFDRLVGPLFGALEVAVFFLFAVRLGYGVKRSLVLTAVLGFATSVWPDEQSILEHTEVAFFVLLGMYFAFRFHEQRRGHLYLLLSGAALGGAAITRYQDAFIGAVAVAVYLLLPYNRPRSRADRLRYLILLGLGMLPFVLIDLWDNWYRFGSILATGHHEKTFGYPILNGAAGLLLSPGKGLLWYCPTIFLLIIVGRSFYRRYPTLLIATGVLCAGFVGLYANVTFWHGDPCWGPRYVYPVIPFLTLPLGEIFRLRTRWRPGLLAVALAVVLASLTIQVAAVSVSQWRTWYRVISYEENKGQQWDWIASRYRYFWNVQESPLVFQLHGLYQMAHDSLLHTHKYELVPPDEDPILDKMTVDYAINQWNFWWTSNEFNWWMGQDKVALLAILELSIMAASAAYIFGEAEGLFDLQVSGRLSDQPLPEAA